MVCTCLAWGLISTLIPGPWSSLWLPSQISTYPLRFRRLGSHGYSVTASELAHWKLMSACLPFREVVSEYLMPLTDFSPVCCSQSRMWRNTLETSSSDDNGYSSGEGYSVEQPPSQNWERNWMSRSATLLLGSVWFVGSESQMLKASKQTSKANAKPTKLKMLPFPFILKKKEAQVLLVPGG